MPASTSTVLQRPVEIAHRRRTEAGALLRVTVVIAVGATLLFGAARMLVTTGPTTEFSGIAPEFGAEALQ